MPLLYGFMFGAVAWVLFTVEPLFDTSWINEMMGLSDMEAAITVLLFIAGIQVGIVAQSVSGIARAHDKLVDKIYGNDD